MLCQTCTQIFQGDLELGSIKHHSTVIELRQAREVGCQMCRLVWASFSDLTTGDISQENISVMYVVQRGKESPAVGYKDIPADLYLLGFSLNVDTVTTKDYKERYTMFIVEPFKGSFYQISLC